MLVTIGVTGYRAATGLEESIHWVSHSCEVLEAFDHLLIQMRDVGPAQNLTPAWERLRRLTADNPNQQRRLEALQPLLGPVPPGPAAATGRPREIMEEIRKLVWEMDKEERELLQRRQESRKIHSRRARLWLGILFLLDFFFLFALFYAVRSDLVGRRKTELALRETNRKLSALIQASPLAIIALDPHGKVKAWNPAAERMFGWSQPEALGLPLPIVPTDKQQEFRAGLGRQLRGEELSGLEIRSQRKDGSLLDASLSAAPLHDEAGRIAGVMAVLADISERKRAEEELRQANEKLTRGMNELLQRTEEIALLSGMSNMLQSCFTAEEAYSVVARFVPQLFPSASGGLYVLSASRNMVEALATWGESSPSERAFAPDDCWALRSGRAYPAEEMQSGLRCNHLRQPALSRSLCVPMMAQSDALGLLCFVSGHPEPSSPGLAGAPGSAEECLNESKRRLAITVAEQTALALANLKLRATLQAQSIRDPLTGLFNRRYLEESLERELSRAIRRQKPLAVIMLDLDHFKQFNDTYGHDGGDALLRELGVFLQKRTRKEDIACRYGGEEFTLILPEASLDNARQRAEQLRQEAKLLPVRHAGKSLGATTLSLGVAVFPEHGSTAEAVLRTADQALYQAKAEGRDRVVVGPAVMERQPAALPHTELW